MALLSLLIISKCFILVFHDWLKSNGELSTIDDIGQALGSWWSSRTRSMMQCDWRVVIVPVNLKDQDAFHLSIEEYLHSLISLVEELSRLAVNSVTLGDYQRPLQISKFVKDIHAGFQILNLKNDSLRKRSDGIKYNVRATHRCLITHGWRCWHFVNRSRK